MAGEAVSGDRAHGTLRPALPGSRSEESGRIGMAKHVVAAVDEIPAGSRKLLRVRGRPIVIFNVRDEFFGLFNKCPHQGGDLSKGALTGLATASEPGQYSYTRPGEMLRCPWHGWEFDIRTGQSYCDPGRVGTRIYPVAVEGGDTIVEGPYVAETVPVSVENRYVVVTM